MSFQDLKCPNCDATLQSVNGIDHYKCPFCQSEILIDLDDGVLKARIAKTEYDYKVWKARHDSWEKEQDFQRSERAKDNALKRTMHENMKMVLTIAGAVILLFVIYAFSTMAEKSAESKRVNVPYSAGELGDLSLDEVKEILKSAGFTDISTVGTYKKFYNKAYNIKSISINGNTKFKAGDRFNKSDKIIITYYREEG